MELLGITITMLSHIIAPLYMAKPKYKNYVTALCWLGYAAISFATILWQESIVIGFFVMLLAQLGVFILTSEGSLGEKLFLFLTYSNSYCIVLGINIYLSTIPNQFMQTPFIMLILLVMIHLFLLKYLLPKFRKAKAFFAHGWAKLNVILTLFLVQFVNQYAFSIVDLENAKSSIFNFIIFSTILYITIFVLFIMVEDTAQKNEKALENKSLKRAVYVDSLTNLKNRGGYVTHLEKIIAKRKKNTEGTCVLTIIDVDKFKGVNDTLGHVMGDKVLIRLSSVMREIFEPYGSELFRIGGDEFAIVSEALNAIDIERHVGILNEKLYDELKITVSFGCAVVNFKDAKPFETAFDSADRKMYVRKQEKKNAVN